MVPDALYDRRSGSLVLPRALSEAYVAVLKDHHLESLAATRSRRHPPVGGVDQVSTDEHFAQAFTGSAGRVALAILDPKGDLGQLSDTLIQMAAGGVLCVVDAPCGAGAASLTYLAVIASLREQSVLPRVPLLVRLVLAEISGSARAYATAMLERLQPYLLLQAIEIKATYIEWDATDFASTARLTDALAIEGHNASGRLLLVANTNHFLMRAGKFKGAERQLQDLFTHLANQCGVAVWVEPEMKAAVGSEGLFRKLLTMLDNLARKLCAVVMHTVEHDRIPTTQCQMRPHGDSARSVQVRCAVVRLELAGGR